MEIESSTLSAKYQVVIPKKLRKKYNLRPGQQIVLTDNNRGEIIIDTKMAAQNAYGAAKGLWGDNSDQFLTKARQESNRDRN